MPYLVENKEVKYITPTCGDDVTDVVRYAIRIDGALIKFNGITFWVDRTFTVGSATHLYYALGYLSKETNNNYGL